MKNKLLLILNFYGRKSQLRELQRNIDELVWVMSDYNKSSLSEVLDFEKAYIRARLVKCYVILEQFRVMLEITNDDLATLMKSVIDENLKRIDSFKKKDGVE